MANYYLTRRVERQLSEILDYGLNTFGERRAAQYQQELIACFETLAQYPGLGKRAGHLRGNFRRHTHGSHTVLYQETDGGVLVAAVFHQTSDWSLPDTGDI